MINAPDLASFQKRLERLARLLHVKSTDEKGGPGSGPHAGVGITSHQLENAHTPTEHRAAAEHHSQMAKALASHDGGARGAALHQTAAAAHTRAANTKDIERGNRQISGPKAGAEARSASRTANAWHGGK